MSSTKILALVLFGSLSLPTLAQHEAEHQHHSSEHKALKANHNKQGKKWESDTPLRQSMNNLRAALQSKLLAIHKGNLSQEDYQQLSKSTHAEVKNMIDNCKLTPEADAALHSVIAELIQGADAMNDKSKQKNHSGAQQVVSALNHYGQVFNHPGWIALR